MIHIMENHIIDLISHIEESLQEFTPMELACRNMYRMKEEPDLCSPREKRRRRDEFHKYVPELSEHTKKVPHILTQEMLHMESNIVVIKHCRYLPPRLHTHEFFELFYVAAGECVHTCHSRDYHLQKGDFCLWEFNAPHEICSYSDNFIGINILIRRKSFDSIFFELLSEQSILSNYFKNILYGNTNHPMIIFRTCDDLLMLYYIYLIYDEFCQKKPYHQYMLSNYLNTILIHLLRFHISNVITAPAMALDQRPLEILEYIQNNYHSISLQDVCRHFNYSPSYLSRLIKKSFGLSFSQIIGKKRMEKACWLLEETNMTISEIAAQINCSDASHFCRIFAREYQMTPMKYREIVTDS